MTIYESTMVALQSKYSLHDYNKQSKHHVCSFSNTTKYKVLKIRNTNIPVNLHKFWEGSYTTKFNTVPQMLNFTYFTFHFFPRSTSLFNKNQSNNTLHCLKLLLHVFTKSKYQHKHLQVFKWSLIVTGYYDEILSNRSVTHVF